LKGVIEAEGLHDPQFHIPSAERLKERVEKWEKNYLSRKKPSTQNSMAYHVRKYISPKFGETGSDAISAESVNEWIGELRDAGLSLLSMRHIVATLQSILGRQFGKSKIDFGSQLAEEDDPACYTLEEVQKIVAQAKQKSGDKYAALFATAAGTGMRAGELYGLQISDLDLERKVIHVRRSAWEGELQSPKTKNSRRAVAIGDSLTALLKSYIGDRNEGLVFPTREGKPLRNSNVLKHVLHPVLRKLGITQAGMHGFRHHRVSELVMAGVSFETIRAWIGHGSDKMIRRYTHLNPDYFKSQLAKVPEMFYEFPVAS
jgi:integrase